MPHPRPRVAAEIGKGRVGHPGSEVSTPAPQHRVEPEEQGIQRLIRADLSAQRLDLPGDGVERLLRWVGVDVVPVAASFTVTVRPVQVWSRVVRRSTATSCCKMGSLRSLVEDVRLISRTSPSICRKIRYGRRSDTAAIMPNRRRLPITLGQRPRTEFGPRTRAEQHWAPGVAVAVGSCGGRRRSLLARVTPCPRTSCSGRSGSWSHRASALPRPPAARARPMAQAAATAAARVSRSR
jgi:hypothetical protein